MSALLYLFHWTKKYGLICLLVLIGSCFFYANGNDYLSMAALRHYQAFAQQWTFNHYFVATLFYISLFALLIACAIPCATFFTLAGGFLFGSIAIAYAELGTTLGGLILFLSVRTAIGPHIAAKSGGWLKKMESGFQKNAFNYLLMLRLMPIFPCWISNIGAGALNVPLKTFLTATLLGIFPATLIYALAGRGLDKLLADEQLPYLTLLCEPAVALPLLGLAILSIIPVIYKGVINSRLSKGTP